MKLVRPDAKGRISLGILAKGVSGFTISKGAHNQILLEPLVEIPAREKWLFDNKIALKQVKQGLKESAKGLLTSKGDFAQYVNDKY